MKKYLSLFLCISFMFTFAACGSNDTMMKNNTVMDAQMFKAEDSGFAEIQSFNTEDYDVIRESGFKSAKTAPLSTFSVSVDTASYSNVRRMINDGTDVTPDAVRIEEFINYFYYNYAEPDSDAPFSVNTEITDCPWNKETKLMSVGLQAKKIKSDELKPSNLVFLLDISGSMNSCDKLPLVKKSMKLLTESLDENDRISIVTYAGADSVLLEGERGDRSTDINRALDDLFAHGGTNGADGIITAYKIAEDNFIENGNNRIILCTDGDLNIGVTSTGDLSRLVEDKRETGVSLTVLGFGSGNIKDNKMAALANNGNGNYYYIDNELEARRVLVSEMGGTLFTVAKDVKLQVEFNPQTVKGYRLLGYENKLLNPEDFNDDLKDAGEIGSGHRVTALYEIALADSLQEVPEVSTKYGDFNTDNKNNGEYLTINIRYKEPEGNKSQLISVPVTPDFYKIEMSDNMFMASSAAEFGMLLRDSEYKGTSNYNDLIKRLGNNKFIDNDAYKSEFLELVKKAAKY